MSRFLFAVPPLTGHVNPTVAVGRELAARGHEVAWVGHPSVLRRLLPEGATLIELDDALPQELVARTAGESQRVRGLAALEFLWDGFLLPLAEMMIPQVDAAVEAWKPDVLISDQQILAGAIVARRRGMPWATSATTSADVMQALRGLTKVGEWLTGRFDDLQRQAGLEPIERPDLSPHRVIVFSTTALAGEQAALGPQFRFVGPSIAPRRADPDFPWDALPARPRVLISLGTVNIERGRTFYPTALDAARGEPWGAILVAPPELAPDPPPNVLVRPYVPQLDLLEHVDAVVCHAGHNTTCEALWNGLPLVVAPIKDDQPAVAAQVAAAGAGVRLRFGRLSAVKLRGAVRAVLDDPSYRASAQRISASFRSAGGAPLAAQLIEELAP